MTRAGPEPEMPAARALFMNESLAIFCLRCRAKPPPYLVRSRSKRPADCWLEAPRGPLGKPSSAMRNLPGWVGLLGALAAPGERSNLRVRVLVHRSAHLRRWELERPPVSNRGEGRPKHHRWTRSRRRPAAICASAAKATISWSSSDVSVASHKARMAAMQTAAEDLRPCFLGTSDLTPQCRSSRKPPSGKGWPPLTHASRRAGSTPSLSCTSRLLGLSSSRTMTGKSRAIAAP